MEEVLKLIDIYKADKKFNVADIEEETSKEEQTTLKRIVQKYGENKVGSKTGGIFSIILYVICTFQLINTVNRMHKGIDDID